ncbi:MAG: hypothetical protein ACXVFQ_25140 [Solirubrobacteraceae bacterium]
MADASRCPECRARVHPFAASCPSCGADLDAYRRRRATRSEQRVRFTVPSVGRDARDLVLLAVILFIVAVYAPLFGLAFGLLIAWHSHSNSLIGRRNVAIVCTVIAIVSLFAPNLIATRVV